ncbi:hypothetical protein SAMD00023353_0100980 [Rosellinia necatrix]|uniref:Family c-likeg-protein-coupled receptor protein n=1 Tax=Rosellinia necatrix TaxID=77044 RepID=A0A1S7UHE1_ROSNE|nr:hypothetical protein SAMD00023353_0100980 [Rosellinia necatrix]
MHSRRSGIVLARRDVTAGNWTVFPSPEPGASAPITHPVNPAQHGPPYAPMTAVVGGVPAVVPDAAIAAVLLALFAASAAAHMTVLQLNKRAGLKFLFSGMLFALCALRSVALAVRAAWAAHPRDPDVAVASGILTQTGSVLVLVIDLLLAQRVVRAYHPAVGWHRGVTLAFRLLIAGVIASLLVAVAVTVQSVFTLDPATRRADRAAQLAAGTYMAALAFLPLPVVALAALLPRTRRVEKFGAGRWRSKVRLLLLTSALATLGAGFRVGTAYATPRPAADPAWYHSRACYYCFNYVIDLFISAVYLFSRFDRRFIVPDGAAAPGDYGKGVRRVERPSLSDGDGGEGGGECGGGGSTSSEKNPEKFAKLGICGGGGGGSDNGSGSGNEGGSEKTTLPLYDDLDHKGSDKGKGKDTRVESDEKQQQRQTTDTARSSDSGLRDAQTQTYGSVGGAWDSVPWPFRASWVSPRVFGPTAPSSVYLSSAGDSLTDDAAAAAALAASSPSPVVSYSPVDGNGGGGAGGGGGDNRSSGHWGAETNGSSTCCGIQEPEIAYLKGGGGDGGDHHHHQRRFYPYPFSMMQPGQAFTSDEQIHLDAAAAVWPSVSDPVASRCSSAATHNNNNHNNNNNQHLHDPHHHHYRPGSGRTSSRGNKGAENENIEGGWI